MAEVEKDIEDRYEKLNEIYYDPTTGFNSFAKFWSKVKHLGIPQKDVKYWLEKQQTYQINKEVKRPKVYDTVYATEPRKIYQMDVLVYNKHRRGNYRYILTVIDVNSRYAAARAMTTQAMKDIIVHVESIFDEMGVPRYISLDRQFDNEQFKSFITRLRNKHQKEIDLYFSEPDEINKNAIIERFNRTLAESIQKWRDSDEVNDAVAVSNSKYWYDILDLLVDNYNNTVHRTIKEKPIDVFDGLRTNKQKVIITPPKLKVGDVVRVKNREELRKINAKGSDPKFSKKLYVIYEAQGKKYFVHEKDDPSKKKPLSYKEYELLPQPK